MGLILDSSIVIAGGQRLTANRWVPHISILRCGFYEPFTPIQLRLR